MWMSWLVNVCIFSCSPLCSCCIASGATSLNTTKQTVWLPWRCPAWWSTPSSPCCRSVTTGTYTLLLTARRPSCKTSPWMGVCWRLSTWGRAAASSTGVTQRQSPVWFGRNWEALRCLAPHADVELWNSRESIMSYCCCVLHLTTYPCKRLCLD